MMNDNDKMDEIIRNAAQAYNRPPNTVPRDEMWTAIEAAQSERAKRPLRIVAASPSRTIKRFTWLAVAAAAVLLVVTGVGIGRWSTRTVPATRSTPRPVATKPAEPAAAAPNENAGESSEPAVRVAATLDRVAGSGQRSAGSGQRVSGTRYLAPGTRPQVPGTSNSGLPSELPYQVATIRHLSNAEALLTAFRSDSRDAKMDAQLSVWARDLLSNTRLLLDSPAADDPQRAKLLGDLELVLAEIVQLSPGASAQDRGLVEGSIRNGHVMTRLRSAIPAGQTRGL